MFIDHSSAIMFADDTSVFISNSNLITSYQRVNEDLNSIYNWLDANKLSINFTKTKYVLFRTLHSKPPPSNLSLSVHGKKIERVSEINFLGITYNENLTWKKHMLKTLGKIRSSSGASPVGGQGGNTPRFSFLPPRFFSCPPTVCFWGEEVAFFGRKKR